MYFYYLIVINFLVILAGYTYSNSNGLAARVGVAGNSSGFVIGSNGNYATMFIKEMYYTDDAYVAF